MVRAFLAIDLPQELKKKLSNLDKIDIPKDIKIKWVEEENFHITLKFFGNIKETLLEKLFKEIQKSAQEHNFFQLSLNEVGFFPQKKTPRVVWIGINTHDNTLFEIHRALKKIFKKFKLGEEKDFHPHITLFRVKTIRDLKSFNSYLEQISEKAKAIKGFTFKVNELIFFESILSSKGPVYRPLYKVKLKNE